MCRAVSHAAADAGELPPADAAWRHVEPSARHGAEAAGGWDPHNVTEDADLGMRLCRLGYRCGVIDCPTYEDAPTTAKVWLNQRTRWFKGWLQTWLVMMRSPLVLLKEMGRGHSPFSSC
nr:glycosyltransferase family 2 protein [Rhizobium grahamii]